MEQLCNNIAKCVEEAAAVEDLARFVARAVRGRAPAQLDLGVQPVRQSAA